MDDGRGIVYTLTANCHDCYRCVRVCPVKAIRVHDGQASVERDLCIGCGTCVRECPQHAKLIRRSLEDVQDMVRTRRVAVSLAPSFPAFFKKDQWGKMPAALKKLGFSCVSETAEGAKRITEDSFQEGTSGSICTACPAVVNYIEKYRPSYRKHLIPIVSPMVAHGRMLKHRLGSDWSVVFIGPCSAKKQEALREENRDAVDGVLTFEELAQWLEEEGVDFASLKEEPFESRGTLAEARLFPLQGGMLKTGHLPMDNIDPHVLHISGPEEVEALFDMEAEHWPYKYVEPLFCTGGCIKEPDFHRKRTCFCESRMFYPTHPWSRSSFMETSIALRKTKPCSMKNIQKRIIRMYLKHSSQKYLKNREIFFGSATELWGLWVQVLP